MKKLLLFISIIAFILPWAFSQQLENPGFELWEDAGTVIDEPVDWSSIKTSDAGDFINNLAPVVWGQSTDAHTGNYSVELTNVETLVIATGTVTNGRIHADINPELAWSYTDPEDERWHTVFTARPDSVAIWVKYYPQGTDTAQVKVLLHVDEGTQPVFPENEENVVGIAQINVWGTQDSWIRVAAPFIYSREDNPEYCLAIMTAGAGLQPVAGSIVYFDDIEMVYDPSSVNDLSLGKDLIYSAGMDLYLGNLPENFKRNTQLDLINLNGSVINSIQVNGDRISLSGSAIPIGLYVIRIQGKEGIYTQKIFLQ